MNERELLAYQVELEEVDRAIERIRIIANSFENWKTKKKPVKQKKGHPLTKIFK